MLDSHTHNVQSHQWNRNKTFDISKPFFSIASFTYDPIIIIIIIIITHFVSNEMSLMSCLLSVCCHLLTHTHLINVKLHHGNTSSS